MVLCQEGGGGEGQIGWFLFQKMKKDWGDLTSVSASSEAGQIH